MKKVERIGEKNINHQGLEMEIVGYKDRRNMEVKFSDGFVFHGASYHNFLNGSLTSLLFPDYLGVGCFGVGEYKSRENKIKTTAYIKWTSMLTRCYSDKYIKQQNYSSCVVCDEWLNFQNFAKWHYENYYEIEDDCLELDKDIIEKGNRIYSPDKCIYVPHKLNTILCNRHNDRGKCLIGVSEQCGKYVAACSIDGKSKYLGTFDSEYEAFLVYKAKKESEIKRVAEQYRGRIPDYIIELIKMYKVEMTD